MSKNKNRNFYKLDCMKEFLGNPNSKEEKIIRENCGMKLTNHSLLIGGTGSGKSNCLMNFIEKSSGCFDKIVLVGMKMESFNKFLKKQLKDDIVMFIGDDYCKLPTVDKLPDAGPDYDKHILLIFDDCLNADRQLTKIIKDYFIYGRSKNVTLMFLSQSYSGIGSNMMSFLRKQVSYILLCGIKNNSELSKILNDYSLGDINEETMAAMYRYCKQKDEEDDLNFMKICCFEVPDNEKISKCWTDYLDPNDFKVETRITRRGRKKIAIDISDEESN